jgi:hypothetical protein
MKGTDQCLIYLEQARMATGTTAPPLPTHSVQAPTRAPRNIASFISERPTSSHVQLIGYGKPGSPAASLPPLRASPVPAKAR